MNDTVVKTPTVLYVKITISLSDKPFLNIIEAVLYLVDDSFIERLQRVQTLMAIKY